MNLNEFVKSARNGVLPRSFTDEIGVEFKEDKRACATLNSLLYTSFKAVYREASNYWDQWEKKSLKWDSEHVYLVTADYRVVFMHNSEWACFQEEKGE